MKYYTGIGSRSTPDAVGRTMTKIAIFLEEERYWLRSGGAPGADTFFEIGVSSQKDIYLPSKGFNGRSSNLYTVSEAALELAESIHPSWERCKPYARLLHARNTYQVLGSNLDTPSEFLICWTENGEAKGGTRTAIKLAEKWDIPILNFGKVKSGDYMKAFELFYMKVT